MSMRHKHKNTLHSLPLKAMTAYFTTNRATLKRMSNAVKNVRFASLETEELYDRAKDEMYTAQVIEVRPSEKYIRMEFTVRGISVDVEISSNMDGAQFDKYMANLQAPKHWKK